MVSYSDLSGFIDSTFDGSEDINDTQAQNYRLNVNFRPSERLNARLNLSRSEIDNGSQFDESMFPKAQNARKINLPKKSPSGGGDSSSPGGGAPGGGTAAK